MRRLGRVVRTAGGVAVVRAANGDPPDIGTPVLDEGLDRVGRIVDVIGPVDRPFVVVAPEDRSPASLFDVVLYLR